MAKSKGVITNIFPLEQLFSIPLQAVVEANANAAETAIAIIKKYGFVKNADAETDDDKTDLSWGKLRYVSFTYNYIDRGIAKKMVVKIPLLSMIPIPLLQVKNAVFNFGVKIVDSVDTKIPSVSEKGDVESDKVYAMLVPPDKYETASLRQTSLLANIDVRVEMVQSDLPAGILSLINLEQQALHGNSKDVFKLVSATDSIEFSAFALQADILVNIKQSGSKDAMTGQPIINFEVIRNSAFTEDIFTNPITITTGYQDGYVTSTSASVRSVNGGQAGITLQADPSLQYQNGVIRISANGTESLEIYYSYNFI